MKKRKKEKTCLKKNKKKSRERWSRNERKVR
jgi:hypothetical protein